MCNERAFKGIIVYSKDGKELIILDGYIVLRDNIILGIYRKLPKEYKNTRIIDYTGRVIIPGLYELNMSLDNVEEKLKRGYVRARIVAYDNLEDSMKFMDFILKLGMGGYIELNGIDLEKETLKEFIIMSLNRYGIVKPSISLDKKENLVKIEDYIKLFKTKYFVKSDIIKTIDRLNSLKENKEFIEYFYMKTKYIGKYFGKLGSFEPGFEFDAIIIDNKNNMYIENIIKKFILEENVEMVYHVYVSGKRVLEF